MLNIPIKIYIKARQYFKHIRQSVTRTVLIVNNHDTTNDWDKNLKGIFLKR